MDNRSSDSGTASDNPRLTPLFVVGAERSGSTMVRLMLNGHPAMAVPFEFDFAVEHVADNGDLPEVRIYREILAQERIFLATGMSAEEADDYRGIVRSFLTQTQQRHGKNIVGATVHHHFDRLPRFWPEARYIHLIRDGRDVSRSAIAMGWAGNMWTAGDVWIDAERCWDRLKSQLRPDQWTELRYEDLVSDPKGTLSRLCEFVGVPFDDGLFKYQVESSYSAPNARLSSQWRTKLSPTELALGEARLSELLVARGYELSGQPVANLSPTHMRWLELNSRLRGVYYRMRMNGPVLFAADVLVRRIPFVPAGLRKRVKLELNRREIARLE